MVAFECGTLSYSKSSGLICFTLKFYHCINLSVQVLFTEKIGQAAPFRPLFGNLSNNLKRKNLWPSLEVHVIYALCYLLCVNLRGCLELKKYLFATDPQVFDPNFIAQYLLVPVNTIVKTCLLPWMMKSYYELSLCSKTSDKYHKY